jgi:hypothetical protein
MPSPPLRDSPPVPPRQVALVAVAYLLFCLAYLHPVWPRLTTHIGPDPGDPVFNLVVMSWGSHQIRSGLPDFWNLPVFFPARGVTTWSDALPGPAAFTALVEGLGGNPVLAFNLLFLGSFWLSGFATFWVLRKNGISPAASFLGGLVFAFSPFRWDQLSHLAILLAGLVPLVLHTFDRLLAAPTWKRAGWFLLAYVLHMTGGSYLAYMIHVPLAVLAANRLGDLWRAPNRRPLLAVLLPTGLAAALVSLAVFWQYLTAGSGIRRYAGEIYHFGASLAGFATPSVWNLYQLGWTVPWRRAENGLFLGILPTALLLYALAAGIRAHRRSPERPLSAVRKGTLALLVLLAAGGWIAGEMRIWTGENPLASLGLGDTRSYKNIAWLLLFGPIALLLRRLWGGGWPLSLAHFSRFERGLALSGLATFLLCFPFVYEPLMHVVPGLSGMRVPGRFAALLTFVAAFFVARTLDGLTARAGRRGPALLAAAGIFLAVELCPTPFPTVAMPGRAAQPPVYAWLARRPDVRALLELPLTDYETELAYMHSATFHWKPLVNGYSGHLPQHYIHLKRQGLNPAPSPEMTEKLRTWGVTHVLVHQRSLPSRWQRQRVNVWQRQAGARLAYMDRYGDRVYSLGPAGAGPREEVREEAPEIRPRRKLRSRRDRQELRRRRAKGTDGAGGQLEAGAAQGPPGQPLPTLGHTVQGIERHQQGDEADERAEERLTQGVDFP